MKFALETGNCFVVEAYATDGIRVAGRHHSGSILVTPDLPVAAWPPDQISAIAPDHLDPILDYRPQVVIIGTGAQLAFPPAAALRPLIDAGIGYEAMDTGAACRTYNLLATEGRRVIGAFIV